jgi:hypothetical protein
MVVHHLHLHQNGQTNTNLHYPLAAEDNPALRPQRMFHAASIKAPLPPGKGGANEINIVIDNIQAKLINQLKIQWPN